VTVVACCGVSDEFITPFTIFKGGSFQGNMQAALTTGPAIAMTDLAFINNGIFLH
jgi:hypothetical protein